MNSRTITIVIVIIILIIAIGAVVSMSGNQTPAPAISSDQTQTAPIPETPTPTPPVTVATATPPVIITSHSVSYTDSGFSPKTLTVKNGESVTFLNNSSGRMWVASDPHPAHTDLPGFDELAAVGPGEAWSYTFTKIGTHGYHNHANHTMTGTIFVQ